MLIPGGCAAYGQRDSGRAHDNGWGKDQLENLWIGVDVAASPRAYSVASRSDTPPSLRLGPAERAAALRLGSPCSRDSAWSAPLPLQQGNALHSSVPQLVWHLASILRKLLHDLLMQPDVH